MSADVRWMVTWAAAHPTATRLGEGPDDVRTVRSELEDTAQSLPCRRPDLVASLMRAAEGIPGGAQPAERLSAQELSDVAFATADLSGRCDARSASSSPWTAAERSAMRRDARTIAAIATAHSFLWEELGIRAARPAPHQPPPVQVSFLDPMGASCHIRPILRIMTDAAGVPLSALDH